MNTISIEDKSFRFGLSAFETILVRHGKPLFKDWHWENLCEAANALGIAQPDARILERSLLGDGIWRWYATSTHTHDFFESMVPAIPNGMTIDISPLRISSNAWESLHKTTSYLLKYQARKISNADETILLNEFGEVASASMANLFWAKDCRLYSPLRETGCRNGVVKRWVIEKSGFPVELVRADQSALLECDEAFLTNSRIGICPVTAMAGRSLEFGKVTREIHSHYRARILA